VAQVDFGFTGFSDNVHTAVFNRFGTVLANLAFRVQAQKLPIGFVEMGDVSLGIRHQYAIVNAIEDQFVHFDLILHRFNPYGLIDSGHRLISLDTKAGKVPPLADF
jgi:hypothetical protein